MWPDLRLVIHGGTKFDPFRDLFKKEIGSDAVKFCEVYPCSEGFVATEDPRYGLLRDRAGPRRLLRVRPGRGTGQGAADAAHARPTSRSACSTRWSSRRARGCGRTSSATRSRSSGGPAADPLHRPDEVLPLRVRRAPDQRGGREGGRPRGREDAAWTRSTSTSARCSRPTRASPAITCT